MHQLLKLLRLGKGMPMRTRIVAALLMSAVLMAGLLAGCSSGGSSKGSSEKVTVYLWENVLFKDFEDYVEEQCPDVDVEFVAGNNNVFIYDYLEKNGSLPDIITTRRFAEADAKALSPYLMDFSSTDVLSEFYPYALQYYTSASGEVQWLPVCGIPETLVLNKSLLDTYKIAVPESYEEFAAMCKELKKHGIEPYAHDLSADYSAHSLLQGSALDQFASIEGIEWRTQAEAAEGEIPFDSKMWTQVFTEADTFIKDTGLKADSLAKVFDDVQDEFLSGKAALRNATPAVMAALQETMDAELIHLPYFSQTGQGSWVYTYPSLNIALNKSLQDDPKRLEAAQKVLDCFLSEEGQKIIAAGAGLISYSANVASDLAGMEGVEEEIKANAFYIRYASNNSFSASLAAISGLVDGSLSVKQAVKVFEDGMNATASAEAEPVIEFEKSYSLALNEAGGRDAASSVLTTARLNAGADIAFSPYYNFATSVYQGPATAREVGLIPNVNQGAPLSKATLTGAQLKQLVAGYLEDTGWAFDVSTKYELPVASGMKMILAQTDGGYALEDIEVGGAPVDDAASYTVILPHLQLGAVVERVLPGVELEDIATTIAALWSQSVAAGTQPAAPEDYLALK